ncbi:MAG TPA: WD40 repeat domain-containing protein [Caulobacteraceae bacterium]
MPFAFDAYVTDARFDRSGRAAFALGDGTVRWEDGARVQAHDGAVLCATGHPSGEGVITGGDDGRLVWSRPDGAETLAEAKGRWIDVVASSAVTGLIAFAAGREVMVRDVKDPRFAGSLMHERTVAGLDFDPKGRRLAAATYGGAALWYARIAEQKPQHLKWAGSHVLVAFSPDGRFLVSAMQENELHGWKLADGANMRMGGYPSKVKSLAFLDRGRLMVTAGAAGAVIWPFAGSSGPMGKQATEVGFQEGSVVARVAAAPDAPRIVAGLSDGRVWSADLGGGAVQFIKAEKGQPISALALAPDGRRIAWGDEAGEAGVAEL